MICRMYRWGALTLLAALLAGSNRAAAQAPETLALAPAIPAAPALSQARGVFFTRTQSLALASPRITLASTSDGRGELCTDDKVTLTITQAQRSVWSWSHAFSSTDRQSIACIAPVTLDLHLPVGSYSVTIVLEDLYPSTFRSTPYFLRPDAGNTPAAPALAVAPSSPVPTTRPAPTPAVSTQPIATPVLPTAAVAGGQPPADTPSRSAFGWLPAGAIAVAVLLALAAWLVMRARRSRPRAPSWQGIVDLFDPATLESRTFPLAARGGDLAIKRQPLRLEAAARNEASGALATIRAAERGPQLLSDGEPVVVEQGQNYQLPGGIQLRYRDLRAPQFGATRSRSA